MASYINTNGIIEIIKSAQAMGKAPVVRNDIAFYFFGANASHVFYVGVDSMGNVWKRGCAYDSFINDDGNRTEVLEISYYKVNKDEVYIGS
jgi:hypothetical protein